MTELTLVIRAAISTDHDPVVDLGDTGRGPSGGYRCVLPWLSPSDAAVLDGRSQSAS